MSSSSDSSDGEGSYELEEPRRVEDPNVPGRWAHIAKVLSRSSPLANEGFEPDLEAVRRASIFFRLLSHHLTRAQSMKFLRKDSKVLCIGAGGLGCDLLKYSFAAKLAFWIVR